MAPWYCGNSQCFIENNFFVWYIFLTVSSPFNFDVPWIKEQSKPPSSFAFYNPLTFYFEKELLCPHVLILHCRSWMPYNITVHFTGSSFNVLYHVINLFLYQVSKLQKCVSTSSAIHSFLFHVRKKCNTGYGEIGSIWVCYTRLWHPTM